MATHTIETSDKDPNRVTIRFLFGGRVTYHLIGSVVERGNIDLPQSRQDQSLEDQFGKRLLARAERLAHEHFFGTGNKQYETLAEARAEEFAKYVNTGAAPTTDRYSTGHLTACARQFLKQHRWDMDAASLVEGVRAFWTKRRVENDKKKKEATSPQKVLAKAFREEEKARQADLFA